ncbi:MAG: hypothetical protein WCJ56_13160 [bacterium]
MAAGCLWHAYLYINYHHHHHHTFVLDGSSEALRNGERIAAGLHWYDGSRKKMSKTFYFIDG